MDTSPSTDPSSAEAPLVLRHDADRIATLTLDSPENRNALSARLVGELAGHLRDIEADDTVRAVVLTHTSNTFCAGADLAEGAREGGPAKVVARLVALLRQIVEMDKPVVAKVDGNVRAGGLGLFAACDVTVAGLTSSFALTEARLGLSPAVISLTVLPRLTDPGGVAVLPDRGSFRRCRGGTYRAGRDRNRGSRRGGRRVGGMTNTEPSPKGPKQDRSRATRLALLGARRRLFGRGGLVGQHRDGGGRTRRGVQGCSAAPSPHPRGPLCRCGRTHDRGPHRRDPPLHRGSRR